MTLNPQVYRDAAELIANGKHEFCCLAIGVDKDKNRHTNAFSDYFRPTIGEEGFCAVAWMGNHREPENQLARTLALLLMAEIVEEEQ